MCDKANMSEETDIALYVDSVSQWAACSYMKVEFNRTCILQLVQNKWSQNIFNNPTQGNT